MCEQKVLILSMSIRTTFSNSIAFEVIKENGKGAPVEIESVFRVIYNVACQGVLSNGNF